MIEGYPVDSAQGRTSSADLYHGPLSLFLAEGGQMPPADGAGCSVGWSYSLSQGGIGFISQESFDSPALWVGVHLPDGTVRWLLGKIVRRRDIPDETYLDYGVAFSTPETVTDATQEPADIAGMR